jgi:lipopolysaccharide biosynthesis glycosyltransferase
MAPSSSTLHVSCAVVGNYVPHSAAMLHSLLAHRGNAHVRIHYLHDPRLSPLSADRLARMVTDAGGEISFILIADDLVEDLPVLGEFTLATWFRTFLPDLLSDVERVVYLDVDTIVLDSLDPLWQTDLQGQEVAAVTNVFEPEHAHRPAALGLPASQEYFNAGVLLMNLAEMRRRGSGRAIREYGTVHAAEVQWPDQDALNVILGARRLPLHPRWNCMNSVLHFAAAEEVFGREMVEEARARPAIRHFEGPAGNKPWHFMCDRELARPYAVHRRQTPWPRYRREGLTPGNVARKIVRRGRGMLSAHEAND